MFSAETCLSAFASWCVAEINARVLLAIYASCGVGGEEDTCDYFCDTPLGQGDEAVVFGKNEGRSGPKAAPPV